MHDTVECPYCNHENDMTNALDDGLDKDNTLDWECEECEKEFKVFVEFNPVYSASRIDYEKCEECGKLTRDIKRNGSICPFPKKLKGKKICPECWSTGMIREMKEED